MKIYLKYCVLFILLHFIICEENLFPKLNGENFLKSTIRFDFYTAKKMCYEVLGGKFPSADSETIKHLQQLKINSTFLDVYPVDMSNETKNFNDLNWMQIDGLPINQPLSVVKNSCISKCCSFFYANGRLAYKPCGMDSHFGCQFTKNKNGLNETEEKMKWERLIKETSDQEYLDMKVMSIYYLMKGTNKYTQYLSRRKILLSDFRVPFDTAKYFCHKIGGTLLSLHSEEDLRTFSSLVSHRWMMLGGRKEEKNRMKTSYYWIDGSEFGFENSTVLDDDCEAACCYLGVVAENLRTYQCSVPGRFSCNINGVSDIEFTLRNLTDLDIEYKLFDSVRPTPQENLKVSSIRVIFILISVLIIIFISILIIIFIKFRSLRNFLCRKKTNVRAIYYNKLIEK